MENHPNCYKYPRPSLTADCVIFGVDEEQLSVLLIERGSDPYKGCWAFPGGLWRSTETFAHWDFDWSFKTDFTH